MLQPKDRVAEWKQKQDPYICCLQETHYRHQDAYRLKVRGWKNIFHANCKQKKKKSWSSNPHIRQSERKKVKSLSRV